MTGLVVRESVTLAAMAERARVARCFVGGVLGGHPCGDDAVLLVSELFGNSVRHSGSCVAGETVTVAVRAGSGLVRVEVTGYRGCAGPVMRGRAGGGWSWWRAWLPGGGGGGVAGGQ
jgi:hypothetical protein